MTKGRVGRRLGVLLFLPAVLGIMLFLFACRPASMARPPEIKQMRAMPVKGRTVLGMEQPFGFGPFKVQDIQRSWTSATAWGFLGYESFSASQTYQFTVGDVVGPAMTVNCAVGVGREVLKGMLGQDGQYGSFSWELATRHSLACTMQSGGKDRPWRLALQRNNNSKVMSGLLTNGRRTFDIQGTDRLEGSSIPLSEASGYYFSEGGNPLGAVEVINQGSVWLSPGQENQVRSALAGAAAAILLRMNLSRD